MASNTGLSWTADGLPITRVGLDGTPVVMPSPGDAFRARWDDLYAQVKAIRDIKQAAYAAIDDPLMNYRKTAALLGWTIQEVMLARMSEKIIRTLNMVRRGEPLSDDEAVDLANIALLVGASYDTD
jgi:hypothetical protein